ncbi:MAG: four helix bundle protein [Saprospiraceae bacterium]|nr:four helix bundle protein [Saprospiraceae bacterium]
MTKTDGLNIEEWLSEVNEGSPTYNLEERTYQFAKEVRLFIKELPYSLANTEDAKQLVRASGSVGANYIEANESLSKKDFMMRIKICRKEAKECVYFIRLIRETQQLANDQEGFRLQDEAGQLKKIFSAILVKSK